MILTELWRYPVKSCAGDRLLHSDVDKFGLQYDRRWMVVDLQGRFMTQRNYPAMCLISARIEAGKLYLSGQHGARFSCDPACADQARQVMIRQESCPAWDCGDLAAEWMSAQLNNECRLVYFPPQGERQIHRDYAQPGQMTAYSDGFPLLLISQASLDDLNQRLAQPVSMLRFRPNLVVAGSEAYAEDGWKRLRIGELELQLVKPCNRCVMPNIDPDTAEVGKEPLATLSGYRQAADKKVYFGQNVIAQGLGKLQQGMQVEVLE